MNVPDARMHAALTLTVPVLAGSYVVRAAPLRRLGSESSHTVTRVRLPLEQWQLCVRRPVARPCLAGAPWWLNYIVQLPKCA